MKQRSGILDRKASTILAGLLTLLLPATTALVAQPTYSFSVVASTDDPLFFTFFPYDLSNHGAVAFSGALAASPGEVGVFVGREGQLTQIMTAGDPAPGGGVFAGYEYGAGMNEAGDVVVTVGLDPLGTPEGVNVGVYRYPRNHPPAAVVIPGVTPAPTGGVFAGSFINSFVNDAGKIAFTGICPGLDLAPGPPGVDGMDLGTAVYMADRQNRIETVVAPGDSAPGGGTFDYASHPDINNAGDIVFGAHRIGEDFVDYGLPQAAIMYCFASVYMKRKSTGEIVPIACLGDPAPGSPPAVYRCTLDPLINDRRDVVFVGDLTPAPGFDQDIGVFLYSKGETSVVARSGDPVPGGGTVITASSYNGNQDLNNRGEVGFSARLSTDTFFDDAGALDTGVFVWSQGSLQLVARTGTVIPGVGTIWHLNPYAWATVPDPGFLVSYTNLNDRGQVAFQASLTDGRDVVLLASPQGN